MIIVHSN